jgi:hypothetical protein
MFSGISIDAGFDGVRTAWRCPGTGRFTRLRKLYDKSRTKVGAELVPVSETVIERLRRYKLSRLALCPGCEFPGRGSEGETRPPARSANVFRRSRTCQCPLPLAVSKGVGSLKGQSGSRSVCQGYRKRNLPARPLSSVVFERAKLISRKQTPHLGTRTTASLACPANKLFGFLSHCFHVYKRHGLA